MEPPNFETIGAHLGALAPPSATGLQLGETGFASLPTASDESRRAWLLAQPSPAAVDEALARSLTNTCGVTVRVSSEARFPEDGQVYYVATGATARWDDLAEPSRAIAKLEAAMTPATNAQAEGWLVMLQAACVRRPGSEADAAVGLTLYSGALLRYPADVAKATCADWARTQKWFPSLAELLALADRLAAPRQQMLLALHRAPGLPPPERRDPTEEERRRVSAMFREFADARPPEKPAHQFHQAEVDEGGLTPQMREYLHWQEVAGEARLKAREP